MKSKRSLVAILLIILFGIVGGTVAYYQTRNTFSNVFNTGEYKIVTEETFESPDNWKPGDTTPKEFTVKNEGNVPAAVKVCFEEKWEDENGNLLPLFDDDNSPSVIINYNEDVDKYWKEECNLDGKMCFYYSMILDANEETKPLIDSVTFNPNFDVGADNNCTEDPVTHIKTCTSTVSGYSGGKYTLDINIETVQANHYNEVWDEPLCYDPLTDSCYNLQLRSFAYYANMLNDNNKFSDFDEGSVVFFGTPIPRWKIESLEVVDNMNIPNNALGSYDVSYFEDGSVMAWYTDNDNDEMYEVYIGANGKVVANPDSTNAFTDLEELHSINLDNLDISNITNMSGMFSSIGRNVDNIDISFIENWDVSNVTNMKNLFSGVGYNSTTINLGDLSNWDTGNVTDMSHMFISTAYHSSSFDISFIENWDVSNVKTFEGMFYDAGYNATTWNIGDLSNWDTRNAETMSRMFFGAGHKVTNFNLSFISNWNVSNVRYMNDMFSGAGYNATTWTLGNLNGWNTSNVTTMESMFQDAGHSASNFNISFVANWDTSHVINMDGMFNGAGYSATTWNIGDLSNWNVSNVESMLSMFTSAGYSTTSWYIGNLSNWDVSKVTNMQGMFEKSGYNATTWNIGNLSNWDTRNVKTMSSMFRNAGDNATTWNSIGTINSYEASIATMFAGCTKCKATLNLHGNPQQYSSFSSPILRVFNTAATEQGAEIIVNYTSDTTDIDRIISTKSANSNVIKGSIIN